MISLVPTLCVGMPAWPLCGPLPGPADAERRRRHSHAERRNETLRYRRSAINHRRIAKSLFQGSDELQRLAESPAQVVGSAADRKVVGEAGDQAEGR